jgi:hypothetical protein
MRQNQRIIRRDGYDPPAAWAVCRQPIQSLRRLEVENLFLRHQLNTASAADPDLVCLLLQLDTHAFILDKDAGNDPREGLCCHR